MSPIRIAMWSGPRNISTALLRSWGNRPDTFVSDEPLYGHYLAATGLPHPGRDAIVAAMETDWRVVSRELAGPVPGGKAIWYQKHMAHHLLPGVGRAWLAGFRQAFLIRDPRAMLVSLDRVTPNPLVEDTGLPQQLELFRAVRAEAGPGAPDPPVIDSRDVRAAPEAMLRALCAALEVEFTERMLRWPAGRRATDGVWAPHWYASVEASTGFAPPADARGGARDEPFPARLEPVLEECLPAYRALHAVRLQA
jgi:hypothetical protein